MFDSGKSVRQWQKLQPITLMFKLQRKGFYNLEPRDENLNKEKFKID